MPIQTTAPGEITCDRMNLLANSMTPVAVSTRESYLPSWAPCFLSLRAKRGNLLSVTQIAPTEVSLAVIDNGYRT